MGVNLNQQKHWLQQENNPADDFKLNLSVNSKF